MLDGTPARSAKPTVRTLDHPSDRRVTWSHSRSRRHISNQRRFNPHSASASAGGSVQRDLLPTGRGMQASFLAAAVPRVRQAKDSLHYGQMFITASSCRSKNEPDSCRLADAICFLPSRMQNSKQGASTKIECGHCCRLTLHNKQFPYENRALRGMPFRMPVLSSEFTCHNKLAASRSRQWHLPS